MWDARERRRASGQRELGRGIDGRERVIAERDEGVADLAYELPRHAQRRALPALAFLHLLVEPVVRCAAPGVALGGLVQRPAQRFGPCRESRPGERLLSEAYTVMSSPVCRTIACRFRKRRASPSSARMVDPVTQETP